MRNSALAVAIAATVSSAVWAGSVQAATVTFTDINVVPVATTNLAWTSSTGTVGLKIGSSPGNWRSPFQTTAQTPINPQHNTLAYTSIQLNSSAVWNVSLSDTLSLFWGSPDSYNLIEFFALPNAAGVAFDSITGSAVVPPATAQLGHVQTSILASGFFQSVRLKSIGQNAFEFTNFATSCDQCAPGDTPIPGAAVLMGSVLAAGIGGMQIMRRRRKAA